MHLERATGLMEEVLDQDGCIDLKLCGEKYTLSYYYVDDNMK